MSAEAPRGRRGRRRGSFIEAEIGQRQFEDFVARGVGEALRTWRTFLFDDGTDAPVVGHLNGARAAPAEFLEPFRSFATGTVGRQWAPPAGLPPGERT